MLPNIYSLSLHDALPIYRVGALGHPPAAHDRADLQLRGLVLRLGQGHVGREVGAHGPQAVGRVGDLVAREDRDDAREEIDARDRKSTRLNSSHANNSYVV